MRDFCKKSDVSGFFLFSVIVIDSITSFQKSFSKVVWCVLFKFALFSPNSNNFNVRFYVIFAVINSQ